jgi:hypothetical protein
LNADDDVSSFGPGSFKYQAFACYDLNNNGAQKLDQFGVWTGDPYVHRILLPFFRRADQICHIETALSREVSAKRG